MVEKSFDIDKQIDYRKNSSDDNFVTMQNLYKSKDYDWALFLEHIVLEKLINA